jgi:hypothetical protein
LKSIQYRNKKDVFADWVKANVIPYNAKVYWPQITYNWRSSTPIHIVFEKNKPFVWPWDTPVYLKWPVTNIDFTTHPPSLPDGEDWDYNNWYKDALECSLQKQVREVPQSFWNWRLQTYPKGNATCDMDVLIEKNDKWIGVEATEIWYVSEDQSNHQRDCFQHISNLIHKRKDFNFKALYAQAVFMESLGGEHYFLLHRIDNERDIVVDDRVIIIPLNKDTLRILKEQSKSRADVKAHLGPYIQFISLNEFFES